MAQQGVLLDQDQFCCSDCLDLLKEPVTIPCGHSYCRSCNEGCWDQDVLKGVYSCPQCRQTFSPRPNLRKNNMLAELVEKLKKTGLQAAPPPALCYAGPRDVACDFCTGTRKQKALMSCLVCLASYCENHLQSHYESPALKRHKLVKATAQLQEKICSHHDKLLEVYCRTDQQGICYQCLMDEHKGHDTVSAAAERTEKQRQLGMSQQKVQQRFQEREKELKELQQAVESLKVYLRDVACDFCTGTRKQKALMSCLVCLASYCETHLQSHYESPALKRHKMVKATTQLQEKICSHHDKLLEVYCRTDQQCICYQCVMDEHKGHDTVSAAAERTEKQRQLGMSQQKVQQRFQEREKELKELQQAVESFKRSAQAAVEDSDQIFTELIRSIERRSSEVKELIRAQEKAQVSEAEGVLEQLKQEIAELRKRSTELEQLSHTEDHIHFLQSYQSLSSISEVVLPPEPKTREQLLQYSCQLTLDPNTAHTHLSLSEGNRKVTYTDQVQPYPDHPDRFTNHYQVLCREGLSGRCYWEVEWSGGVDTAVSHKDISRTETGWDGVFGYNNKSWSLQYYRGGYYFRHNNVETKVSGPQSSRVGVYLDHKAGTLSFYSISDTMTLLHRVQTTFTQPLYPGFSIYYSTAELVKL
eukprot:XP_014053134.1 PREDICTED: tripartite motif-containing protein 16-like [Salmo salar]